MYRGILLAASLAAFLTPFFSSAVTIALPAIGESMSGSAGLLALLPTAYLISSVVFLIPSARIAEIAGLRRVFLAGLMIGAAGTGTGYFAPSIEILLLCQIVSGLGFACVVSNSIALLSASYPKERRGAALGVVTAAIYLGLTAGPLLGGVLTDFFGWNSIYAILCGLCIAAAVIARVSVREEVRPASGEPFDIAGAVLYGGIITLLMTGLTGLPDYTAVCMVIGGAVLLIPFIRFERKSRYPVFALRLFEHNRAFVRGNIATMINFGATYAVGFFMSLYLQIVGLLTPWQAGLVLVSMSVVQMVFSPLAGKLSDRISPKHLMTAGMFITGAGLLLFLSAGTGYNGTYIILILALLGFSRALFGAPNMNLVLGSVSGKDSGSANSINATMRQMGMVVSMAAATCFLAFSYGGETGFAGNPEGLVSAMHMAFILSAVLCFLGTLVSWSAQNK